MNGKPRFSPPITTVIVLVWLAGLLGFFFVGQHKRELLHAGILFLLNSTSLLNVPDVFWQLCVGRVEDLGATALLLASAWCLGLALLRGLRWAKPEATLLHLLAIATGLGAWAWFVLIAGTLGLISAELYCSVALVSLALIAWHWRWLKQGRAAAAEPPRLPFSGPEIFLLACLGCGAVLNLIPTFSPEVEYDALEYHLGALKEYQKAGRICFLPHNFYASMPSLTEMLYLWGITLRSSTVAKLIHTSFAALTAWGLVAFGRELHSRRLGLTAAALYYLLPFVTDLGETARIDLATAFFAFLAGAALHRFLFASEQGDNRDLWLAGFMAGLTLATKYTAAPLVLLPLLVVLLIYRGRSALGIRQPRVAYRNAATQSALDSPPSANRQSAISNRQWLLFLLLSLIPVLPWLVKNTIFTGNPVYPIANGLFHSPSWDAACAARFQAHHGPTFGSLRAWASFVTSAWDYSTHASFASPILLLFAPLFLLIARPEPRWKFCAWYGGLIYVCWFAFTFRPWRFVFPALPWFALLGAVATLELERDRAIALLTRVTLGLMLVFNLNYSFLLSAVDISNPDRLPPETNKLGVFFGRTSAADYLGNVYFTQGWLSGHLPPDACVLYVGEARTYYARYRVLANTVYDKSIIGGMVAQSHTPGDLLLAMKKQGVTHIYINRDELKRLQANYGYLKDMNWPLFDAFLDKYARVIFRNNAHSVYELHG